MNMSQYIFRSEVLMPLYKKYTKEDRNALLDRLENYVRKVSPMNTGPCRRYLEDATNQKVSSGDVLWCFYNIN